MDLTASPSIHRCMCVFYRLLLPLDKVKVSQEERIIRLEHFHLVRRRQLRNPCSLVEVILAVVLSD